MPPLPSKASFALTACCSVYALPNAVIPLLSGPFFSKYGRWSGVIAIATLIFTGICVTGLGVYSGTFWLMVVGRLVYGLGGESIYVGVDILVTRWFKGERAATPAVLDAHDAACCPLRRAPTPMVLPLVVLTCRMQALRWVSRTA